MTSRQLCTFHTEQQAFGIKDFIAVNNELVDLEHQDVLNSELRC